MLTALNVPPNNGSTVTVRVVDYCVRRHGYPAGPRAPPVKVARIEAHPIAVIADVFFGVYAIGLGATVRAVIRVPLRVEPFANGGVYIKRTVLDTALARATCPTITPASSPRHLRGPRPRCFSWLISSCCPETWHEIFARQCEAHHTGSPDTPKPNPEPYHLWWGPIGEYL